MKVGFIGQGFIGKNYADDFENRGFSVVRYALEDEYRENKDRIKECDVVFIAVPTPTTPDGFDDSIIRKVVTLVGDKKMAVIKSTILPGTTESIQKENPDIFVFHSPEFLSEATAAHDAANPPQNIVGVPVDSEEYREKAQSIIDILPHTPHNLVCAAREAELFKYTHNCLGYSKVIFMNILYDVCDSIGARWDVVKEAIMADPMIANYHIEPVHKSGRGAGGNCFIKDMASFSVLYERHLGDDKEGREVLRALQEKNKKLLKESGKDLDLLRGVYGSDTTQ